MAKTNGNKYLNLTSRLMKYWTHYCPVERCEISVGQGEDCNWCGETDPKPRLVLIKGNGNGNQRPNAPDNASLGGFFCDHRAGPRKAAAKAQHQTWQGPEEKAEGEILMTFTQAQKRFVLDTITKAVKNLESSWEKPFKSREKAICQVVASTVLNLPSD